MTNEYCIHPDLNWNKLFERHWFFTQVYYLGLMVENNVSVVKWPKFL